MGIGVGRPPRPEEAARPSVGVWFRPPRLRTATGEAERRHATWLELFFDVVFVVAIAELSHQLVIDHSFFGFLRFAGLFIPVLDRKSTRLNSSHANISYAVFCLK